MSVVGCAGGMVGWIAQTLFALKTFFIDGVSNVEFEVIDDIGFKLGDVYHSMQVKNDFSGNLNETCIKNEIIKMRKKIESFEKYKLLFVISTNDSNRIDKLIKAFLASFPENKDIEFQIFEKLEEDIMIKMSPFLKHVVIDKSFIHIAASFISAQVFDTYKNTQKGSKDKIILSKTDFHTFLNRVTYGNIFAKLFSLETEIMESASELPVDKYNAFNSKYLNLYEEAEYVFMHTKYSLLRKGSIEQQILTGNFFNSQETSAIIKYKSRSFQNLEEFKDFFNDFINETFFVPRHYDKNVDESIRRGLLITSVEEKNEFS